MRPQTAKYNIEYSYVNYDKYESKQSSQDSYIANKKHIIPQTAKLKRKSKHKYNNSNNNHYKSHSYGDQTILKNNNEK